MKPQISIPKYEKLIKNQIDEKMTNYPSPFSIRQEQILGPALNFENMSKLSGIENLSKIQNF